MSKATAGSSCEEVCARCKPSTEALALLKPALTPEAFVAELLQAGLFKDAVAFAACTLGKQEAVWWGCLCVWHARGSKWTAKDEAALAAAVRWVIDQKDETRAAAAKAGEAAGGTATTAGALASAAGWGGGSMTPPGLPVVPPPEFLTQNVVAAVILSAAAHGQPANPADACRQFLLLAKDVASGKNRWEMTP